MILYKQRLTTFQFNHKFLPMMLWLVAAISSMTEQNNKVYYATNDMFFQKVYDTTFLLVYLATLERLQDPKI